MSTAAPATFQDGGDIPDFSPDGGVDTRLYVNGTRIPVGKVNIHIRKEGPLGITHYAEATFASPFDGVDYVGAFDGTDPTEQERFDILQLTTDPSDGSDPLPIFTGFVTGLGNTADGPSRMWRCRAQGIEHLLDKIEASVTFGNTETKTRLADIAAYVAERLTERSPFTVDFEGSADDTVLKRTLPDNAATFLAGIDPVLRTVAAVSDEIATTKTFQANKHTLSDVLDWAARKTNGTPHLRLRSNLRDPSAELRFGLQKRSHVARYLGGELQVVDNDALNEMRPINTAVVKGSAQASRSGLNPFNITASDKTYITAKARHTPLYRRAGGNELRVSTETQSDAATEAEVEREAKQILRERIGGATEGRITTIFHPRLRPFDQIVAKPTCDGSPATDVKPITYEVNRVHHQIRPNDDEKPKSILNVGIKVDTDEDISIVRSWEAEV
jgi:hypothetical protein